MRREKGLDDLLTDAALRELAGSTYYARGSSYFASGSVEDLRLQSGRVMAHVAGTHLYTVRIWASGGQLDWACSCPLGEEGEACKHFVAVGLAYLARGARERAEGSTDAGSITQFLEGADKATLVHLLVERMTDDPDLKAWLLLKAQLRGYRDDRAVMRALDQALDLAGDQEYEDSFEFFSRAESAGALLEGMLAVGDYRAAAGFSEYALRKAFSACDRVDDSDGGLGELLDRIATVHRTACAKAGLDGEELAERLFALLVDDEWGVISAADYRGALGAQGRARFEQIVRDEWSSLRPLIPGSRTSDSTRHRSLITGLMRDLAVGSGDVDRMLEVEQRDLSDASAFLRIAEILTRAKRNQEALEWVERGLAAFPSNPPPALVDFAVGAYLRRKQYDPALAFRWQEFTARACAETYQVLKKCARSARQWPVWRERALAHLKALTAKRAYREGEWSGGPSSELVEIYLTEGDLGAALEQARAGGCSVDLWRRVAQVCETERPEDAIKIYRGRLDAVISKTNNHAYDQAAETLRKIGALMRRHGEASRFLDLLGKVMMEHKAKRNFMKRLEPVVAEAGRTGVQGDGR